LNISNFVYKALGILFLCLAKSKNVLKGYSTPRTFSNEEYDIATKYDINVVESWLTYLSKYNSHISIENKNILELGPGADLGVGLYCSASNGIGVFLNL